MYKQKTRMFPVPFSAYIACKVLSRSLRIYLQSAVSKTDIVWYLFARICNANPALETRSSAFL
jgi:hypothetical protein